MTLRDRVPVEPLDDDRLARIERAIVAGLPQARPRVSPWRAAVPWAFAVAATAALLLVAWRLTARAPAPAIAPVAVAASAGGARLDIGDAVISAGPGAELTVTRPGGGVDVALARGRIELEVASRHGRPPLLVHADDVEVVVVGTRFSVEWDDEVSVIVTEGVVRVRRGGETTTVAAGQRWSEPAAVAVTVAPEAIAAAGGVTGGGATGAAGTDPGSSGDTVALHDRTPGGPPPDSDGGEVHPRHAIGKKPKKSSEAPAPEVEDGSLADLEKAIRGASIASAADVGAHGTDALEAYRNLASGEKGAAAARGLYGMARVQHLSLGKNSEALRNLEQYVKRFPNGAELEAVLWLRLRILCLRRFDDSCRSAAHTYLTRVGGESTHARLAERVTVTVTP